MEVSKSKRFWQIFAIILACLFVVGVIVSLIFMSLPQNTEEMLRLEYEDGVTLELVKVDNDGAMQVIQLKDPSEVTEFMNGLKGIRLQPGDQTKAESIEWAIVRVRNDMAEFTIECTGNRLYISALYYISTPDDAVRSYISDFWAKNADRAIIL